MPIQIGQQESGFANPLGLLSDCHRRIERFLGVLSKLARERRGAALTIEESGALDRALTYFREAAPKHTDDEEDSLFPRIRHSPDALAIIDELETDHETAEAAHQEVEILGLDWLQKGSLAEHSANRLVDVLTELQRLYAKHISIEDGELFPLASQLLNHDQLAQIGAEMASRRSTSSSKSK